MQSPRGAVIGKFCSYLACQFKGLKFLACCGPCCPLLKLLLIKKIYHLNTLHLYPAKTNKVSKTNKERVTEFLYHAVQLPTSDCSIFAENEGLVQIKSLYNPSRLWSRLQTTLAQITRIAPKWIYTVLKFFHSLRFLSNLFLPWKQSCPEKIHCIEYILFTFRSFEQLALALKNRVCPELIVLNIYSGFLSKIYIIWDFWATCACHEKESYPGIFHCI